MSSETLDPNLNAYRPDLAARALEGRVEAARFVDPVRYQVSAGVVALRKEARDDAEQLSQALHGDIVDVYEELGGFGWGQMRSDGYVGWFDMSGLSAPVLPVTHRVSALRTYAFSGPRARAAPHFILSLNAHVSLTGEIENGFAQTHRAGWVYQTHVSDLDNFASDPVGVAEQFLHAPYQWGGVESLGLDCSGLIQTAYRAAGRDLPRDSYMMRTIGTEVKPDPDFGNLQRGDIVCWQGHVALMVNGRDIIHANGHHMAVVREPLADAIDRIARSYGAVMTVRRL